MLEDITTGANHFDLAAADSTAAVHGESLGGVVAGKLQEAQLRDSNGVVHLDTEQKKRVANEIPVHTR